MKIYLIIALYQGNCDGVVFSSTNESEADQEYRKLVREALELYTGRSYINHPWTDIEGRCQFGGCRKKATHIACGRYIYHDIGVFCEDRAYAVANEGHPEYVLYCPNCDCMFGIN